MTEKCTVPDCNYAQSNKSKVCVMHRHKPKYCRCQKCTSPVGKIKFESLASVSLSQAPWD